MFALHTIEPCSLATMSQDVIQRGPVVVTVYLYVGEVLPSVGINPESAPDITQLSEWMLPPAIFTQG